MNEDDDVYTEEGESFYSSGNVRDQKPLVESDAVPRVGHNSGDDELKDLNMDDLLREGRRILMENLVRSVKEGYAGPQEMAILRQMLKDNGCVMGDIDESPDERNKNGRQKANLPSFSDPTY
jgi:hypothetical protein